jgi:hypothetical protein
MDCLTIERGIWSVAIGAFFSLIAATLAVPFGSLAWIIVFCVSLPIGAVVVYRVGFTGGVGRRTDEPGRLTLLFFVWFVIALVGHMATSALTSDGSIPEILGQALSLGVAWWLANWVAYRGGVERLRNRATG